MRKTAATREEATTVLVHAGQGRPSPSRTELAMHAPGRPINPLRMHARWLKMTASGAKRGRFFRRLMML
jgi:hypothetical protein